MRGDTHGFRRVSAGLEDCADIARDPERAIGRGPPRHDGACPRVGSGDTGVREFPRVVDGVDLHAPAAPAQLGLVDGMG